jgi:dipeptidyl aminopeptidase/acylaminoacyl peptidase
LVTDSSFSVYDTGPGWDRPVPGTVIAVGPTEWLVDGCDALYGECRNEVVDVSSGTLRALPGPAPPDPFYFSWPPTGVISPDGSTAAVAENGRNEQLTLHLVDLRTGATMDLGLPLAAPDGSLPAGGESSMVWSPDGRWLFVATAGGKLLAVDPLTGRAESLGVSLPAVDQVAIRP